MIVARPKHLQAFIPVGAPIRVLHSYSPISIKIVLENLD